MLTKEGSNFPIPLDEESLAPLVTTSQSYRLLPKRSCNYWLINKLLHTWYGLEGSLLNESWQALSGQKKEVLISCKNTIAEALRYTCEHSVDHSV